MSWLHTGIVCIIIITLSIYLLFIVLLYSCMIAESIVTLGIIIIVSINNKVLYSYTTNKSESTYDKTKYIYI